MYIYKCGIQLNAQLVEIMHDVDHIIYAVSTVLGLLCILGDISMTKGQ